MKLLHILRWLVLLLSTLLALQLLAGSTTPPRGAVDELFDRYSGQEGVRVAVIHGMPVNDTLNKDILMLTATDSAGWAWIVKELSGYDEGTVKFNNAMRDAEAIHIMSAHYGTMEAPGVLSSDPALYDRLKRCDNRELVRVSLLYKTRTAWITIPKTRAEANALLDLEFEEGNLMNTNTQT